METIISGKGVFAQFASDKPVILVNDTPGFRESAIVCLAEKAEPDMINTVGHLNTGRDANDFLWL